MAMQQDARNFFRKTKILGRDRMGEGVRCVDKTMMTSLVAVVCLFILDNDMRLPPFWVKSSLLQLLSRAGVKWLESLW